MFEYAVKRLLSALPTIFLVSVLVFSMLYLTPGDPAVIFLGNHRSTPELLAKVRHDMGLDRPVTVQYGSFIWKALHGDFGRSLDSRQPVRRLLAVNLPATIRLTLAALGLALVFGFALGIVSAVNHNTYIDTLAMMIALLGVSMPVFWSSLLLIFLFSVRLHWFPAIGQGSISHLVLPAFALGLISASILARLVRSSMLEVLNQDYVRTATAKGLRHRTVVLRHALKNALIPTLTVVGIQFGQLLSGAVITETIFARRGIGNLYVQSILNKDFPTVQALTLLIAVVYVLINLLVDMSYALVDPRIRYD